MGDERGALEEALAKVAREYGYGLRSAGVPTTDASAAFRLVPLPEEQPQAHRSGVKSARARATDVLLSIAEAHPGVVSAEARIEACRLLLEVR
jgi:hypothetical protein